LQESRTKTTSFMVMLVSAMFVDKMTCDVMEKKLLKKNEYTNSYTEQ